MLAGSRLTRPASTIVSVGLDPLEEHVVERRRARLGLEAEGEREAGLRIEIHEEHPFAEVGEGEADGLGRRGLRNAALLVGDREHPRHGRRVYGRRRHGRPGPTRGFAPMGRLAHRWAEWPIRYTRVPFVTSLTQ